MSISNIPVSKLELQFKTEITKLYNKYFSNNRDLCEKLITEILKNPESHQFIINDLCIQGIIIDKVDNITELENCLINRDEILEKNEMWIYLIFIRDCMKNTVKKYNPKTGKGYAGTRKRYNKGKRKTRRYRRYKH